MVPGGAGSSWACRVRRWPWGKEPTLFAHLIERLLEVIILALHPLKLSGAANVVVFGDFQVEARPGQRDRVVHLSHGLRLCVVDGLGVLLRQHAEPPHQTVAFVALVVRVLVLVVLQQGGVFLG